MATRRRFFAEYRQPLLELTRSGNKSARQIARDPGIGSPMLSRWRPTHDRVQGKVLFSSKGRRA